MNFIIYNKEKLSTNFVYTQC